MTAEPASPPVHDIPGGCVSSQVRDLLRPDPEARDVVDVSVAPRSPLGPFAVSVLVGAETRDEARERTHRLATRLAGVPWVARAVARTPTVYLQVADHVLREWVGEAFRPGSAPAVTRAEGAGQRVLVQLLAPPESRPGQLAQVRAARVARTVAAVLRAQGYDVASVGGSTTRRVVVTTASDSPGHATVGPVDVPHGPLLARHGGVLFADDLVDDLRAHLVRRWNGLFDPGVDAGAWCGTYAEAFLTFLLLRAPRTHHVVLGEAHLFGVQAAAFDAVVATRVWSTATADAPSGSRCASPPAELRSLLMAFDTLPRAVEQAANDLDAAPLVRFVTRLTERVLHGGAGLPPGDPVRLATAVAIDRVLDLLGIVLPAPLDARLFERRTTS